MHDFIANGTAGCRLLVVGDVMLDKYFYGEVTRISPEAPVPITHVLSSKETLGGAANVAHNLARLGCKIGIVGYVGETGIAVINPTVTPRISASKVSGTKFDDSLKITLTAIGMTAFNPFTLAGNNILVTGASSGIGQQIAITCSKMGARMAIMGRSEERLEETRRQLVGSGHLVVSHDLTELDGLKGIVKGIASQFGPLDGLVNCAGISTVLPLQLLSPEIVEEFFRTNVYGTLELTRQFLNIKNVNKQGASVIFFASVMGVVGENAKSLYSMTKGALISGCRSLAIEYAAKKVRVNVISPGIVETAINKNQPYLADPEKRKITEANHPLGLGTTVDIANACVYLLSDASRWVTGHNLVVDGGYTAK